MKTAILYLSRYGQTQKIAEHLAAELGDCQVFSLREETTSALDLEQFDCIVLGASIRFGRFDPLLEAFISKHGELLKRKKSAFYSVNLTARKPNKDTAETNIYTRKLLARIAWQPNYVAVFAGALRYPIYPWFDKTMIRFIMTMTGGGTDISQEYEYTNWEKVRLFAEELKKS